MFKKLREWFTKPSKAEQELEDRFNKLEEMIATANREKQEAVARAEEMQTELNMFRDQKAEDENRRNSSEPWVEIKSADYSDNKGFRIDLDWNTAFIDYLKESGIKGKVEEEIVQKWLAMLYQHLVETLESKVIDEKDKKKINDFE